MSTGRTARKTFILFYDDEPTATVNTSNEALKRLLAKLEKTHPAEVWNTYRAPDGLEEYRIPKTWVRMSAEPLYNAQQMRLIFQNSSIAAAGAD